MSNITVHRSEGREKEPLPIFREIAERLEQARRRAYELFEGRGREPGRDLEDWIQAEMEVLGGAKVDFEEKPGQYDISLTLPGFDAKQVQVTVTPTEIAVHATKKDANELSEVLRRFETNRPLRTDQVTAKLEKGVLHIVAPCASHEMTQGSRSITVAVA